MTEATYRVEAQSAERAEPTILLFEELAQQEGWQPGGELRQHVGRSCFFSLTRRDTNGAEETIGGLQLVPADAAGFLPDHAVWPELPPVPADNSVAHILVLALLPAERWKTNREGNPPDESAPFWHLCLAMWRHCVKNGIREVWMEATPKMLRAYRFLGMPLVVQGELRTHWGEPCCPCSLSLRSVAGSLAEKALQSPIYRSLFLQALSEDDAPQTCGG